jgi:hypothetical protein
VIYDRDIEKSSSDEREKSDCKNREEQQMTELFEKFAPMTDELDRRILFDVTKMRID